MTDTRRESAEDTYRLALAVVRAWRSDQSLWPSLKPLVSHLLEPLPSVDGPDRDAAQSRRDGTLDLIAALALVASRGLRAVDDPAAWLQRETEDSLRRSTGLG